MKEVYQVKTLRAFAVVDEESKGWRPGRIEKPRLCQPWMIEHLTLASPDPGYGDYNKREWNPPEKEQVSRRQ